MTIKKYTGKTKEEAIAAAKAELGSQVVIMNIKEQKQKGLRGIFSAPFFEVTAAIEEEAGIPGRNFDMRADEPVALPPQPSTAPVQPAAVAASTASAAPRQAAPVAPRQVAPAAQQTAAPAAQQPATPARPEPYINEQDLRSAFREIGEMVEKEELRVMSTGQAASDRPIVKKNEVQPAAPSPRTAASEGYDQSGFVKMLYNILMDNEVDEKYVNQILEDLDKVISSGSSLDYLISNVYQKLVLKLGKPHIISLTENVPKLVFIIGPTGVGKTTTIAKLAAKYKLEKKKNVALITTDTYRIAATDQLQVYADILSAPLSVVIDAEDFNGEVEKYRDMDLVLVDTAGFSHKNQSQKNDLAQILEAAGTAYDAEVYLVLSATTKYQDLKEIVDTYKAFTDFSLIFTKLDETSAFGNVLNMKLYTGAELSYVTNGQNVPDDIAVIDSQKLVKQLLGGR